MQNLTVDEAVAKMSEATQQVDWVNLGRVCASLGDYGQKWGKYDKSRFKPNYERAFRDRKWLATNASSIGKAFEVLRKNKDAL